MFKMPFIASLAIMLLITLSYVINKDFEKSKFQTESLDTLSNQLLKNGKMVYNILI